MTKASELEELKSVCLECDRCRLAPTRTHVVFGQGDPGARIMFVGEGPGAEEDRQGYPFVGNAGKLLNKMLMSIGVLREEVYIGNIIKCRPPGNRDPLPDEIAACKDYLIAQIAIIQPKILCTLGRHAAMTLLEVPDFKISRDHGRAIRWKGMLAMPMFHPAAALHQGHFMDSLKYDFEQLGKLLKKGFKTTQA